MNPTLFVALGLAWTVIAVLFGVLLGTSIKLADKIDAAVSDYTVELPDEDVAA